MKDYSNQIRRMSTNTVISLALSKEFSSNGWYKKASNKEAFVASLLDSFKNLVAEGAVTPQMVAKLKGAKSLKEMKRAILQENSGMRKASRTEAQIQALKDLEVLGKALEMGKFAGELLLTLQNPEGVEYFSVEELSALLYGLRGYVLSLKRVFKPLHTFSESLGQEDLLVQAWQLLGTALVSLSERTEGAPKSRFFVTQTSKGFKVTVPAVITGYGLKSTTDLLITKESVSLNNLKAMSRLLVVDINGVVNRYNTTSHISVSGNGDLRDFCQNSHLSLFQVMSLMNRKGVDKNSLLASGSNWILLEEFEVKSRFNSSSKRTALRVSKNPLANPVVRAANAQCHFWGISSPDTLHKGIFKSLVSVPGFCEVQPDGSVRTVAEKGDTETLRDGSVTPLHDAAKMSARVVKLCRKGVTFNLGKTFVVTGNFSNNSMVTNALSTGTLHTCTDNLNKVGQCRVVSGADKGGMKATFGSMGLIDAFLDSVKGVSLVSMNSLKSNTYGLKKVLGLEESEDLPVSKQFFANFGCELTGVWVDNFEVEITNFYTIQSYKPVNRDEILNSWDRVLELKEEEISNIGSNISEDKVFLEYVLEEAEVNYQGNLVEALKSLEAQGIIERKGNTTTVTSSEFDRMAMSHGEDKAIEWMDNLLADKLNKSSEKAAELELACQLYTGEFNKGVGVSTLVEHDEFFNLYNAICTRHGIDSAEGVGSFVSRDFLVDLCLELFKAEEALQWMGIRMKTSEGPFYARLPLGETLYGDFYRTSTIYEEKVVVTGFIEVFLKAVTYVMKFFNNGRLTTDIFKSFAESLFNRLYADSIGKGVGRLNARGMYGVLSPAWWSATPHLVTLPGAEYYSKQSKAIIAKHPLLFDNSLAQVEVESSFPARLTRNLSGEALDTINFVFSTTLFCHAEWLLALQNDCDGDLGRITFHKGFDIPNFKAKTLEEGAVGQKFFEKYVRDEENFLVLKDIVWSNRTVDDLAEAATSAARAKADVAKFTSNLQLFSQRFTADTGISKESKIYHTMDRMLGIWVQEFSMMAIKHNQISRGKGTETEMFGQQRIIDMKLPDFYQITTLRQLEMSGEESNPGEKALIEWLDENGFNKKQHGMKNNTEFAKEVHKILCNIGPRSVGADILGKDYSPEEVAKFSLGQGSISNLNPKIMQDLLLAKLLGLDIQAMEDKYQTALAERQKAEKAEAKAKKAAEKAAKEETSKKTKSTGTKSLMGNASIVLDDSIKLPL